MKLFIASDIHGDLDSAEKLVEAYKASKADKLILLGDILYHGPRNDLPATYAPKSVIELLNSIKDEILCVRLAEKMHSPSSGQSVIQRVPASAGLRSVPNCASPPKLTMRAGLV